MIRVNLWFIFRWASIAAWFIGPSTLEVQAAETTMTWSDDLCENTIRFDPSKYDEPDVRNTIHLLFGPADFATPMVIFPIKMQDVAKLLDGLNKECSTALERAKSFKFLPLQGIEDYRRARISELQDWCKYEGVKLRGLRDPSVLREYTRAPKACSRFVEAMEGKSNLADVFRETVDKNCKRNGSPAQCVQQRFAEAQQAAGDDGMRLYLTTFAWSNCAVRHTLLNANAAQTGKLRESLEQQFRRIFEVARDQCDSPSSAD